MSANIKQKVLTDKVIGTITLSVFAGYILIIFKVMGASFVLHEFVIGLQLLYFFGVYIYFPRDKTILKGIVLSIFIPFLCSILYSITIVIVYIIDWKLPVFLKGDDGNLIAFIYKLLAVVLFVPYAMGGGWAASLGLLVTFGVCSYFSRVLMRFSGVEKESHYMREKTKESFF